MTLEDKLEKLKEYEKLEAQGMLLKLPCPIGTTLYRIDSSIRSCSYYHNTRDDMYHCINDYKCRHICDGKCDSGVDYKVYAINNADAQAILGNMSFMGTRVFVDKEEAEKELARRCEEERRIASKVSQKIPYPYDSYGYCDYLYDEENDGD